MMLTARFKTCALAACLLTACLLLPDTQAKAESISLPEPVKASQTQPDLLGHFCNPFHTFSI